MIHHFLNEFEIQHLNKLHKVDFCGGCEGCRNKVCTIRKIYVDNNIACDRFIEEHNHTGKSEMKK